MDDKQFSLSKLVSDIDLVWKLQYSSPEGLSAWFVATLVCVAFIFLGFAVVN